VILSPLPSPAFICGAADFSPSFSGFPVLQSPHMNLRKYDWEIFVMCCFAIYLAYLARNGPWTPNHIAGAVLIAAGYVGWLIARLQIREFFTPRAEARGLVTTGIYSKIRNPIYFFGTVIFLGIVLYASVPWWGLLLVLLITLMQFFRARNEARVLEAKFGDAYRQYRAKTWF
jgi:protein-S-isoprenylcysteine O-methyltransferase Ste14